MLGSGTLNNFREMRLRLRQGAIGVGRWAIYPLMPGRGDTKHEKPRAGVEPAVPMALRPALVHVGPVEAARPRETRSADRKRRCCSSSCEQISWSKAESQQIAVRWLLY